MSQEKILNTVYHALVEQDVKSYFGDGGGMRELAQNATADIVAVYEGKHAVSKMCNELCVCGLRANHGTEKEEWTPVFGDKG